MDLVYRRGLIYQTHNFDYINNVDLINYISLIKVGLINQAPTRQKGMFDESNPLRIIKRWA
jgi:hypothetical protein